VHQTIEEIHRIVLDGKLDTLDELRIRELFDRTFRFLCLSDVRRPEKGCFVDSPHFFGIKETGVGNANFKNLEEQQASLAATSYLAHHSQLDFLKTFSLPVRWDVARH
jgi:hypothetical protein